MAKTISINKALASVRFLPNRTPKTTDAEASQAFALLSRYRDGSIFTGHYAGNSEWERHCQGDEIVLVLSGATTLFLLEADIETAHLLQENDLLVVPKGIWHRFETPDGVKILSVTPEPTEHRIERPDTN